MTLLARKEEPFISFSSWNNKLLYGYVDHNFQMSHVIIIFFNVDPKSHWLAHPSKLIALWVLKSMLATSVCPYNFPISFKPFTVCLCLWHKRCAASRLNHCMKYNLHWFMVPMVSKVFKLLWPLVLKWAIEIVLLQITNIIVSMI